MMGEVRYAVHPGHARSDNDRGWHFISGGKLMALYGLTFDNTIIIHEGRAPGYTREFLDSLTHLHPSNSGNYNLPDAPPESEVVFTDHDVYASMGIGDDDTSRKCEHCGENEIHPNGKFCSACLGLPTDGPTDTKILTESETPDA